MEQVRQQYQRFPYPPISALALPRRGQGQALQYERAVELARDKQLSAITPADHHDIRILVVGCGTLEALVVAQAHPQAREIVALDLSQRSLASLRRRLRWARARDLLYLAPLRGQRLPPVQLVEADVLEWQDAEGFDYILANNMLHHTEAPATTLQHLTGLLKPGGVMRVVTYPAMSRFWVRQTSAWLQWHGLSPATENLKQRAAEVIEKLPQPHPIRSCFEAHSETVKTAGLVDAFFHVCEKPLSPMQWQQATETAGLEWLGETQSPYCRAEFLPELLPATKKLTPWQQLQVLDDVLELNTNPVWWFCKRTAVSSRRKINTSFQRMPESSSGRCRSDETQLNKVFFSTPDQVEMQNELVSGERISDLKTQLHKEWYLPSETYWQLGLSLQRAERLLQPAGCSVEALIETMRVDVGPRVAKGGWELLGLTMGEYPTTELLNAQQPMQKSHWQQLQSELGAAAKLKYKSELVPGVTLTEQAEWLQLYHGPLQGQIGPLTMA